MPIARYPLLNGSEMEPREAEAGIKYLAKTLEGYLEPEVERNLLEIIDTVEGAKAASFKMVFDPTLVRGMSYYTGTIFEISMPELGAACGGVDVMIRWLANLPDRMCRHVDFPSVLSVSSFF